VRISRNASFSKNSHPALVIVENGIVDPMERANKGYGAFLLALGLRESSGAYEVINPYGYLSKYQMGERALIDAGYYLPDGTPQNDWVGHWTGKDGAYSKEDFLRNPWAQERAVQLYLEKLWKSIRALKLDDYTGKEVRGTRITQSGLLAGAYLMGVGNLEAFLHGEKGRFQDALGTNIQEYLELFQGYELPTVLKA
jgi:hypothetical protein